MAKKQELDINTVLIIVALIIFAVVVIPKLNLGGGFQFGSIVNPLSLFDNPPDPECTFEVDFERVCLGNNVTGTLNAKSPVCYIGYNYNYDGWKFAGIVSETTPGFYEESRAAPAIGRYEFAAICGTPADFCRTNNVVVYVDSCDDDGVDDTTTYTCGWVGEQCWGTCPDTHPLCVDMWTDLAGGYAFCACIDPDTETVHPDWKPDGEYHDDDGPENGEESIACTDTDGGKDYYTKGHVTGEMESGYPIDSDDACTSSTRLSEFFCYSVGDNLYANWETYNCENEGKVCIDGICVDEEPETIGEYCNSLGFDRHWDTPNPGNCPQAAINYCEPLGFDNEYFYDYEKLWCCYKCI